MARDTSDDVLTMRTIRPDEMDDLMELVGDIVSIQDRPDTWHPYDRDGIGGLLGDDAVANVGLYDEDKLVGAAFLLKPGSTLLSGSHTMKLVGLEDKGTAELTHIMVNGDWRRCGYAQGMVDDLMKLAASMRSIKRVYALVHPHDRQSRKLFERSNFITCCGAVVPDGREMSVYARWLEDKSSKD